MKSSFVRASKRRVNRFRMKSLRLTLPFIGLEALTVALMMLGLSTFAPAGTSAAVPSGFSNTLIVSIGSPTDIAFLPSGKMLVTTQGGVLYLVSGSTKTSILDLSGETCSDFERGMLGVAVDPQFNSNHYIYVFHTYKKIDCSHNDSEAPVNRVLRYVMNGNAVDTSTKKVLVTNMLSLNGNHNAGDLLFGKDDYLYISIGDSGCELNNSSLCGGQNRNSRKTNYLTGKILRITRDGGIPSTNPYQGSDSGRCNVDGMTTKTYCQETFVWGLRNPFRIALDPNASGTKIYIDDVGQGLWEEIDQTVAGSDYGWNIREGFCPNGSTSGCTTSETTSGMRNPIFAYQHDGCNSITGGAFVPNGVWPSTYNDSYLYADYVCGKIFKLKNGSSTLFGSDLGPLTTLQFGPYGSSQALYYASYSGEIRRISTNRSPIAVAKANPTSGDAPLTVKFDGSESSDPDGDSLTYAWNFGDGDSGSGAKPTHVFEENVTRTVKLTVSDSKGGSASATIKIMVGNTPPTPVIESPLPSALFSVGQEFVLHGSASDDQEGDLPDSALKWDVKLHHDTHEHPLANGTGNDFHIVAPAPEDLMAATNSYLVINLTATDASGLSKTVTQKLMPKKVNITVDSNPTALTVLIEGSTYTTPVTVTTWAANILDLTALDQLLPSGEPVVWDSWSVPGSQTLQYHAPGTNATVTADYELVTGPAFAPTADARVREGDPTRNEGTATGLTTLGGPSSDLESLLRFEVSGIGGPVVSATLYLFAYDGTSNGPAVYLASNNWSETGVKWTNKPAPIGSALDDSGSIANRTWFTLDVTDAITGNGKYSFLLKSTSSDAMSAYSREASSKQPRLVIVTSGGSGDTTAPSIPTGLAGDAPTSSQIKLNWDASTDDTAVTGYDIFRNGVLLTSIGKTSYTDLSVKPSQHYDYRIRARDAAGNLSGLSSTLPIETPATTRTLTFTANADTYVSESQPSTNYGRKTVLRVEGGSDPELTSYIRFSVKELPGSVYRAKVRIYVPAGSSNGTVDGPSLHRSSSSWNETSITWTSKPAFGPTIEDAGAVGSGVWIEYDVSTAIVIKNGNYAFALVSTSNDQIVFSSREGERSPQLVVTAFLTGSAGAAEVEDEPASTPTPTATPSPTPTATTTATVQLPISDGFESGDLSEWSVDPGFAAIDGFAHEGSRSAVAQSSGSLDTPGLPASASRSIGTPQGSLYVKFAFYIDAHGAAGVNLFAGLDEKQRPLVTIVVDEDGKLALRNERTGQSTPLGDLSSDAWHVVQLHVNAAGSKSRVDVWLDDELIYGDGQRLRGGKIAAVRFGDVSVDRTFKIAFDDVQIDTVCIGTCPAETATPEATATFSTPEPTVEPTTESPAEPTATPTPVETAVPTEAPTIEPTATDIPEPTATPSPTPEPTQEPDPSETPEE